jgi:hypothetical protein
LDKSCFEPPRNRNRPVRRAHARGSFGGVMNIEAICRDGGMW